MTKMDLNACYDGADGLLDIDGRRVQGPRFDASGVTGTDTSDTEEPRLVRLCGHPRCINPRHLTIVGSVAYDPRWPPTPGIKRAARHMGRVVDVSENFRAHSEGETFTADDVRAMLFEACIKAGGQAAWADKHGISRQQVNNALRQGDSPGGAIARALGLRRNPYTWSLDR